MTSKKVKQNHCVDFYLAFGIFHCFMKGENVTLHLVQRSNFGAYTVTLYVEQERLSFTLNAASMHQLNSKHVCKGCGATCGLKKTFGISVVVHRSSRYHI